VLEHHGRIGFEALHVHDLPLAAAGVSLARKLGIPCILDLHENFPALLADSGNTKGLVKGFFFNTDAWRKYEAWAVANADRIIVVVDEAAERLRSAGAAADRITVVSNTPDPGRFRPDPQVKKTGPLRMIYAEDSGRIAASRPPSGHAGNTAQASRRGTGPCRKRLRPLPVRAPGPQPRP